MGFAVLIFIHLLFMNIMHIRLEVQCSRKMGNTAQDFTVADPLMASSGATSGKAYTKDEARGFKEIFPDIVRELTFDGPYKDVPEVNSHVAKVQK